MYFQQLLQKCFNRRGQFAGLPLLKTPLRIALRSDLY
jgi:hypothetical protein